jgi:hypothetical protein
MSEPEQRPTRPVHKTKKALAQPAGGRTRTRAPGSEASESFRSARSAIDQITADLERLRHHAASLVKGAPRPAK